MSKRDAVLWLKSVWLDLTRASSLMIDVPGAWLVVLVWTVVAVVVGKYAL